MYTSELEMENSTRQMKSFIGESLTNVLLDVVYDAICWYF